MTVYLAVGIVVCLWFTFAAAYAWKAPDFGVLKSMNDGNRGGYHGGGRSFGGSWGIGK